MRSRDCEDPMAQAPEIKSLEAALALLLSHARPVDQTEEVPLEAALGRVLAAPVVSALDVPAWDNSAMDGYAVRAGDLSAGETRLPVSQRIPAGVVGVPLAPGTAARVFTGAPLPAGADTVVIQEVCRESEGQVLIRQAPRAGANVRRAGEDIRRGQEAIPLALRLRPQHLGLAASLGVARLTVHRRLRVALLASGDELAMPGEPLGPGQIYNSNQFTLTGLLQGLGCEVLPLGIVADSLESTVEALADGARRADLVLASGGVSVGEEDHVKPAVERLGSLDLWRIAIRPGKPLAFGHIQGTPFIGSPGNPVSVFATFCLFARPFILRRQGVADVGVTPLRAFADFDWNSPEPRREFVRARMEPGTDGAARVRIHASRSSAVLSSVTWANGFAVIPEGRTLHRGEVVDFLPFAELLS
jgi:molybdopterin molybdotransferase